MLSRRRDGSFDEYGDTMELKLKQKWNKIIKVLQKVIQYIYKSSCLMSNTLGIVVAKGTLPNNQIKPLKKFIMKFLEDSISRHKKSYSSIGGYKKL